MYREVCLVLKLLFEIIAAVLCVYGGYTLLHDICKAINSARKRKKGEKRPKKKN